jgi:hypothetical protein
MRFKDTLIRFCILLFPLHGICQTQITVDASKVLNTIPRQLYGSCIEDVNHEIYGGLYGQRLYGESFEEPAGIKGWKSFGGEWQLSGDVLTIDAGEGYKLIRETPVAGGVETQVKFGPSEVNAGVLVRVSKARVGADLFFGYEVSLDPVRQMLVLGKHMDNWKLLTEKKVSFEPAAWNTLRVQLSGARIYAYVNNEMVIDYTDQESPLLKGQVGLRTYKSDAQFRHVVIGGVFSAFTALGISGAWDGIHTGGFGLDKGFSLDNSFGLDSGFNGKQCQVITGKGGISNSGLNRWGIATQKGQRFDGRVYLRQEQLSGPVTVALESADGSRTYASQQINKIGKEWGRYNFSLVANTTDPKARFSLSKATAGKLWIDQAVLMSGEFKGLPLRADIAVKMQEEGLNFLRYGGTMVNAPEYHWKNMIGDPDKRPPYKGHWYPYSSNSFGIEDFLQFCEATGFEAAFAINIEESAEDAADLVEYLKGDINTKWGKMRADNGHAQPYKVKYIEIGNEESISSNNEYDHYIERFNVLYKAMNDTSIKFINAAWWRPESPDMERVFKALDGKAAYWDLHTDGDNAGNVDKDLTRMQTLFKQWNPATTMKCTIFEENGGLHNVQRALGHAVTLNAVRRHGDFVLTSCPANALQPLGQNDNGWDQGQIFFTPSKVWAMPPFYAQQMAAAHHEPLHVMSTTEGDLDVTATRSEDGKSLVLHVVNTTAVPHPCNLIIEGFDNRKPGVSVSKLLGKQDEVLTFDGSYTFPAASYIILKFSR